MSPIQLPVARRETDESELPQPRTGLTLAWLVPLLVRLGYVIVKTPVAAIVIAAVVPTLAFLLIQAVNGLVAISLLLLVLGSSALPGAGSEPVFIGRFVAISLI